MLVLIRRIYVPVIYQWWQKSTYLLQTNYFYELPCQYCSFTYISNLKASFLSLEYFPILLIRHDVQLLYLLYVFFLGVPHFLRLLFLPLWFWRTSSRIRCPSIFSLQFLIIIIKLIFSFIILQNFFVCFHLCSMNTLHHPPAPHHISNAFNLSWVSVLSFAYTNLKYLL